MTALAFSDVHGSYSLVSHILQREKNYELIILAGDLTTHGSVEEAAEAIQLFKKSEKPIMCVAGNMDSLEIDEMFSATGIGINGRGVLYGNIGICGISGSPLSLLHTPYEITENELMRNAEIGWKYLQGAKKKIFVPHCPPYNTKLDKMTFGMHVGSRAVRTFIERYQPDVVICGHIHESRGIDSIGVIKMINCGPASRGYYARIHITDEIFLENCERCK